MIAAYPMISIMRSYGMRR